MCVKYRVVIHVHKHYMTSYLHYCTHFPLVASVPTFRSRFHFPIIPLTLLGLFMGMREACVAEHLLCGHAVIETTLVIISLPVF